MSRNPKIYYDLLLKNYKRLAAFTKSVQGTYRSFFENVRDAVYIIDPRGRLIFFNKAAEELTGYLRQEVLGKHFRLLFTLDDLNDGFLFYYQTIDGCYSEHCRFRIRKKDGSTRVIDVLAAPVMFDGRIRAAITIARDVTGIPSHQKGAESRTLLFKKFSNDLEEWNVRNELVKSKVRRILRRLNDGTPS